MSFSFSNSFMERRDSFAPSLSSGYESSFSSTFSTPEDDLPNPFEMYDMSSSFSSRSSSPPHQMVDMSSMMIMPDTFLTPNKPLLAPSLMSYDPYPYGNEMYSPFDTQGYPNTMPELQYDLGSSPMEAMHTPTRLPHRQFVDPAATFLSFEPSTPTHASHIPMQSPTHLTYFISPIQQKLEHQSPSPFDTIESFTSDLSERSFSNHSAMNSSVVLHQVTNSGKVRKSTSKSNNAIGFVPEGKYKCHHPGCKSEHAFKRQEHLKRHMKTHSVQKLLQCSYCHKKFQQDRSDNYRSHVRLHSKKDSKGSRTRYFPEAEIEVAGWAKDRSRGSTRELAPTTASMESIAPQYLETSDSEF